MAFTHLDYWFLHALNQTREQFLSRSRQRKRQEKIGYIFSGNEEARKVSDLVAKLKNYYEHVKVLPGAYACGGRMPSWRGVYIKDKRISVDAIDEEAMNKSHVPAPFE